LKKHKGYIEGLAWSGIETFLHKEAYACDVDIDITKVVGLIRKTYFFTITGEEYCINLFRNRVSGSVKQYNNE
jgi:hypothetical protein